MTAFGTRARAIDGRCAYCKTCGDAADRIWKRAHPEKTYLYRMRFAKKDRLAHPEKYTAIERKRWEEHREHESARYKSWRTRNKQKVDERDKRHRARKLGAEINDLTNAQWLAILDVYGHRCAYCGARPKRLTQDHVIPLSKGGNNTAANVVPACRSCNSRKRTKIAPDFQPMLVMG